MKLAMKLAKNPDHIKNLSIGFNRIKNGNNFNHVIEDDVFVDYVGDQIIVLNETNEFFKYMIQYLHKTRVLTHLHLAGLDLITLCEAEGKKLF